MNTDMARVYQAVAPKTLDEVRGQDRAVAEVKGLLRTVGLGGNCLWIVGESGHGKSLIAGLVAAQLADPPCVTITDAGRIRPSDVDAWDQSSWQGILGFDGRPGRVYVIEEAHGLKGETLKRLLVWTERLPRTITLIFTTTTDGQTALFDKTGDAGPLLSRCFQIRLNHAGMSDAVAEYLYDRLPAVIGVNGKPLAWYRRILLDSNNNVRKAIQTITMKLVAEGGAA
jgi:replication-associated recombination protein RarA